MAASDPDESLDDGHARGRPASPRGVRVLPMDLAPAMPHHRLVEAEGPLHTAMPALAGVFQQVFACPTEIAEAIGRRCAPRSFPAGAAIVRQGDAAGETFLLVLGLAHALAYGRDGQRVLLQEFRPGDIFGAVTERLGRASESEVVAVEDTAAAVFLATDFLALLEAHACVGLAVSRMLLRQLQAATDRMVERTTLSSVGRIHAELLRLASLGDGRAIRPAPVLAELAGRVNTTRETASRAVNALERRGVIRRDPDALVILARGRLEELVV